ncbi:MAG TPA: hypothetical protein PKX71_05410 [Candidatus Avimonas sp.]|nr:hypothetical protein [Candidatus Avimonas sp.]HQA16378.1 hypothetical protein [Candidatus Avimonas sp.]HQD37459.1 hypothetical protein [Candidatus Avimonas sp.]
MVTQFRAVLDRVKAEDELIEKTERYLRAKLENPASVENLYFIRRERRMKKILAACIAAVLVIGVLAGGYTYLKTPVAYISLDINPSIELGINALNRVVSAEGANRDGRALLEGQKIISASLTDALDSLIGIAAQKNYISDDGTTVVSITAESNNRKRAQNLTNIGEQAVNKSIVRYKVRAVIYKDSADLSLRLEARKKGVSSGKLKLIKSLQALEPSITVEQYKNSKVSDLLAKAKELVDAYETADELNDSQKEAVENLKAIVDRAEKSAENADNRTKEEREAASAALEEAKKQAEEILNKTKTRPKPEPQTTLPNIYAGTKTTGNNTRTKETTVKTNAYTTAKTTSKPNAKTTSKPNANITAKKTEAPKQNDTWATESKQDNAAKTQKTNVPQNNNNSP